MLISFFEEYPHQRNLAKLKLVTWPTKLYLAAKSLKEFKKIKKGIKSKNVQEFVYWPVLDQKEGYWISPFSKRKALLRIFKELENQKKTVMLDLELPTTRNPFLYFTQGPNFFRNRRLIKKFINDYWGEVYLAEYYPQGEKKERLLQFMGLHYPQAKVIKMVYHSMHSFINEDFIEKELKKGVEEDKNNFLVALGTIAKGVTGKEPLLTVQQLKKDLQLAKKTKVSREVVRYRLEKLEKQGIIRYYMTLINTLNLNFLMFRTYYKFTNLTPEKEKEIIQYLQKKVNWVTKVEGKWNLTRPESKAMKIL